MTKWNLSQRYKDSSITSKPNKLGKMTEQTFFKRGNADGQQACEKKLLATNHKGNANQNHNEVSPHMCQNGYHPKDNK